MLGENNTVLNLKGLLRTSGKRAKSPGPRMDEVDLWLLFRFVLTHCWLSEDSKCLGTATTSGESLAAAQEKKTILTQRHLSGVNRVTGTLWPPRPPSDPYGFSSHSPCQSRRCLPPVLSLQCSAPALPLALLNQWGREESAWKEREKSCVMGHLCTQ